MHKDVKPVIERLYENVNITDNDCWEYKGATNNAGYSMIRDGNKMRLGHRVSYEEYTKQPIPAGKLVCHKCYNYRCVNPQHLFIGTKQDSVDAMMRDGRGGKGNRKPHKRGICPHCHKDYAAPMLARWHGDNCKSKP